MMREISENLTISSRRIGYKDASMSFVKKFAISVVPLASASSSQGQDFLRYRFQLYDEDDGRVDVESHYLDYQHSFGLGTKVGVTLAVDSLSGMTPIGTHARGNEDEWLFQDIDDTRKVGVISLDHEVGEYDLSFEYAHSKEEDYVSNAVTAKVSRQFNQKNTKLTLGMSRAFDQVLETPFTSNFKDEDKDAFDLFFGVSQIWGINTLFDLNLGYGYSSGYLSDPYRKISQIRTVNVMTPVGVIPVTDTFDYPENRPDELHRFVAKASVRHYLESVDATLKGSYRFFANSDSLEGHTFDLRWIQQVTPSLSISPYFRYYVQSEADFYYPSLTGTGIDGDIELQGDEPHYSSDYRLSAFDSINYGIRFAWEPTSDLTLDLQLERYEMSGRDSSTPDVFFPSANVVSVGVQWKF